MHSRPALAVAFLVCVGSVRTQSWSAYIEQRYPDLRKVSIQRLVDDAQGARLIQGPQDVRDLKAALAALRSGKDGYAAPRARVDHSFATTMFTDRAGDIAADIEWNDDFTFAVPMTGSSAEGDNGTAGDVDVFRWEVAVDSFATGGVVAGAGAPITDSTLTLLAADGNVVAFNDDFAGLLSQIGPLYLPAGTYYWAVGSYQGSGGGSYGLSVSMAPANVQACGAGTTAGVTLTDAWTITMPVDGELDLGVTATNPGADLALALLFADGSLLFFVDDHVGSDPGARIGLPAGTYHLEVFDIAAGGAEPYTISCAVTPGLTDLGLAGAATGTVLGQHEADLFAVNLPGNQALSFAVGDAPQSATNLGDTIVALCDRHLRMILEVDDSYPTGFYSAQTVSLPAATYYLQVRAFPGSVGDYRITATTGLPYSETALARPGIPNPVSTTLGAAATHALEVCTEAGHVFTMTSDYYGVVDASGAAVVGNTERADLLGPRMCGLSSGTYHVVVYDRFQSVGSRTFASSSTDLMVDAQNDFVGHCKGQSYVVLADELFLTTPRSVHPQVAGLLGLLNPVSVFFVQGGSNGRIVWFHPRPGIPPPGLDVFLQQVEFAGPNGNFLPGIFGRISGLHALR